MMLRFKKNIQNYYVLVVAITMTCTTKPGNTNTHSWMGMTLETQGLTPCDTTYFYSTLRDIPCLNTAPKKVVSTVENILYQNQIMCGQETTSIFHTSAQQNAQDYFMQVQWKTALALASGKNGNGLCGNPNRTDFFKDNVAYDIAVNAAKRTYMYGKKAKIKTEQIKKQRSYAQQIKKEKKKAQKQWHLQEMIKAQAFAAELEHAHKERHQKEQEKKRKLEEKYTELKKELELANTASLPKKSPTKKKSAKPTGAVCTQQFPGNPEVNEFVTTCKPKTLLHVHEQPKRDKNPERYLSPDNAPFSTPYKPLKKPAKDPYKFLEQVIINEKLSLEDVQNITNDVLASLHNQFLTNPDSEVYERLTKIYSCYTNVLSIKYKLNKALKNNIFLQHNKFNHHIFHYQIGRILEALEINRRSIIKRYIYDVATKAPRIEYAKENLKLIDDHIDRWHLNPSPNTNYIHAGYYEPGNPDPIKPNFFHKMLHWLTFGNAGITYLSQDSLIWRTKK